MDVLGDLVARDRLDAPSVLDAAGTPPRTYDYHRFCTNAWRTGNFLRHLGVREGATVAVADEPVPESVLAFLGAILLGAAVRFDPPRETDARVVIAPTDRIDRYDRPRGSKRVGYGARPEDPTVSHFETEMWSENPTFPETDVVNPGDPALVTTEGPVSHRDLLAAGDRTAADHGFGEGSRIVLRAPFARPGTLAAGVVAPLTAGATIVFPAGDSAAGDVAVLADGDAPEDRTIRPDDVLD